MTGQPSTCRSCGANIIWAYTQGGKHMPLDAEPTARVGPGVFVMRGTTCIEYEMTTHGYEQRYLNHFATCPQGKSWSKGDRT